MDYHFEVSEQPAQHVLSMRTFTPVEQLPDKLGEVYTAIIGYLGEIGESTEGPAFAGYYNMDMENLERALL